MPLTLGRRSCDESVAGLEGQPLRAYSALGVPASAAGAGRDDIVTLLLDRGARIDELVPGDENALIQASARGRLSTVKLLVERGANVNTRVWEPAIAFRPNDISFQLRGEWRSPLGMARRGGDADVVNYLLSAGATD
jgi:ankyrin repeat protein